MNFIRTIIENITASYASETIPTNVILSVLAVVLALSVYEFAVYRLVSHRSFYNRSFNISIAVVPFFIATIVLCLQSNLVLTLGTIGALAIIRFRTAVKDPIDMVYLLWSIHTGIICGCRLFEVGVLTSLVVTIVLLVLEHLNFGAHPQVLVVHTNKNMENDLTALINKNAGKSRIKSRCSSGEGFDYVFELTLRSGKSEALISGLDGVPGIERFSLIDYDSRDIL